MNAGGFTVAGADRNEGVRHMTKMKGRRRMRGDGPVPGWAVLLILILLLCMAGAVVITASRIARRPVAVRIVGSYLPEYIGRLPAPARALVLGALARADRLFPQTEETADELVGRFGLPGGRIVRLPNYVADIAGDEAPAKHRFSGRCVFVGQIKREKGVFDLIEAISTMRGFHCDLYGPLLARDRGEFFAAVGAAPNVTYRGELEPEEVRSVIGRYDVLLLPSYHPGEGYPGVILEAFAAGVPVVAGDWKSIPRLVADGERGILVPVRAPGKIREALARLQTDEDLCRRISRNARSYVGSFTEGAVVRDVLLAQIRGLIDAAGRGEGR